MRLTKEHVEQACLAGLNLTDPDTDLMQVFRKHASGILVLRAILEEILQGKIALQPAVERAEPPQVEPPPEPEADD